MYGPSGLLMPDPGAGSSWSSSASSPGLLGLGGFPKGPCTSITIFCTASGFWVVGVLEFKFSGIGLGGLRFRALWFQVSRFEDLRETRDTVAMLTCP